MERTVRRRVRVPGALISLGVAVLLAIALFPEVFVAGGSLSPTGLNDTIVRRTAVRETTVYPDFENREARTAQLDIGARTWQLEPAIKYMNRVIYDGESLEWNRYSAGGMLATETMADVKLSPFVLLVALLGATTKAFTFVVLLLVVAGLYCLQQLFVRTLSWSRLAGVAAGVFFILNGWGAGVLGSQTAGPYLLFPIVLYALCEWQRTGGRLRFLAAVGAHAALFATTFFPGVVLVLLVVHPVALLLDVSRVRDEIPDRSARERWTSALGRQAVVPGLAVLVTAVVWLPAAVAVLNGGDELSSYSKTDVPTRSPIEAFGILTPRHFYRWYLPETAPSDVSPVRWTLYLGVVPLMAVIGALPRATGVARRLIVLTLALTVTGVGLYLGVPALKWIASLPGLRPISGSYWASFAAAAATLALGAAVETIRRRGLSVIATAAFSAVMVALFGWGAINNDVSRGAKLGIGLALLAAALVLVLSWAASHWPARSGLVASLVVGLLAIELLSYQNHERVLRYDREQRLPEYLSFIEDNVGDQRVVSAGRGALYPEWGAALGIRQIETLNLMQAPWYRDFFTDFISSAQGKFLELGRRPDERFTANPFALDQMSVKYLIVDTRYETLDREIAAQYPVAFDDTRARVRVYENTDAFPRAYVSPALTNTENRPRRQRWDARIAVTDDEGLLAEAAAEGVPSEPTQVGPAATIVEDTGDRLVVEVNSSGPGVLTMGDTFHPDWSATVNGDERRVGMVNDAFKGVVVPSGQSTVVFEFDSGARRAGALISLVSVVALLAGSAGSALVGRRRARRGLVAPSAGQ